MKKSISLVLVLAIVISCFAISSFVFAETSETNETVADTGSPLFLGNLTGTANSTTFLTSTDGKNTLGNAGFEGTTVPDGKTNAASFIGDRVSVTDENAFRGSKSLKFTAGAEEEVATLVFNVSPNTKYQFSFFMNCSEYDYAGGTDLTFGIADPQTGYFIDSEESLNFESKISDEDSEYVGSAQYSGYYKTYQMSPTAYDNQWHMTGGFFTTGDKTQLSFVIRGTNVTAYIDNFAIFLTEGDVILGSKNAYWNLSKYWNLNDGLMTFKSVNYSSERHAFILSLRLDNNLKAGNTYTLSTDMKISVTKYFSNFCVYYSDTLPTAASEEATSGKAPTGSTVLYKNYQGEDNLIGLGKMPSNSFTFTPETDLSAGGYISVRFFLKGTAATVTATEFILADISNNMINSWNFTRFDNGIYTGTDSHFSDTQIKGWFPELTEYDTDVLNLRNAGGIKYIAPLQNLEHAAITNSNATLLGAAKEKNLVKNFDFSAADTSFWTDNTSWMLKDTLRVVNTSHSIQGKAFLYDSNRKYPYGVYYIKWIDVEPDTEYTFSARYSIEESGDGFIGIVDGYRNDNVEITKNSVTPKLIGKIDFSEENFVEGYEWQSGGFSFNTKDRNRVGIAVCDDGGKAYLDDIRVFKTADAKALEIAEDNIPDKIISTNEAVIVNDSVISFAGNTVTLNDFRNNFEFGGNIRVWYANGTELKGEDFVGTGCVAKLMNGNVLKESATVLLKGDITGDGNINAGDLVLLRKAIIDKTRLEGIFANAADLHTDSKINILDFVALKKLVIELDTFVRTVIGAPELNGDGSYIIPFEAINFHEMSGAYYFKIKLPACLEVKGVTLSGEALADPDYENQTGEYSVDGDNNLILSNMFNDGGDTFTKVTHWEITATLKDASAKGSFPIEISKDSFVIDMETNIIEFKTVNNILNIK